MTEFEIASLPEPLFWKNRPLDWQLQADDTLIIEAGPATDWFADPAGRPAKDNAPVALFIPPDENFTLSAKVLVDFASTFDAGVLQVRASDSLWGKLCFEYSPQEQPMIVSVVTHGLSDDCNSRTIEWNEIHLRVARLGEAFAFHYSFDGRFWHMVRHFTLGPLSNLQVGFSSQSPTGQACQTIFSEIEYRASRLNDIRSGE
jgi:regulation of enolase protein 1 (concanavalin A-like superfamily)